MATTPTIGQVEDRLHFFMQQHRRTMRRFFCSIGMFNGHPFMLFLLRRHPGITQKELAARMEISPASVAISVRRMEAAGLVHRERDEKDRRVTHLYLTPTGEELDVACASGREFLMDTTYRGLSEEELATLYTLLEKMTVNLQAAADSLPDTQEKEELL